MRVLAVIPARGGSKGIPRKNVRLMNGKPLIAYAIENAKCCDLITDVVVSSDDEEILTISKNYGAYPLSRDSKLAQDAVTLDPVIYDAVIQMERIRKIDYDIVVTLQPTSPLLTPNTLNKALKSFINGTDDTYISVTNNPHLAWSTDGSKYFPLYKERLNRQQLEPYYLETGSFFISRRSVVTPNSRIGKNVSVYEIPERESTDIDTISDWVVCESMLRRKTIVLRCDGYKKLGMGHIYRCLTLAYHLTGHNVIFVTNRNCDEGLEKIKNSFFPYRTIDNDTEFFDILKEIHPDIVVNDCLDTIEEYVKGLKSIVNRVVTFEDLGDGSRFADAVINALYESKNISPNYYFGEKYIDLRDEFLTVKPIAVKENVSNVFVMFGGTDPSNLTERIYNMAKRITSQSNINFTFVVGISYDCTSRGIVSTEKITVYQDVKRVSEFMQNCDLAFTSQGRTVFELACVGVPSIVLAQNKREQLHTFAQMQNGFLNLGLGADVHDDTIEKTFEWLCSAYEVRTEMSRLMQQHDLKNGLDRICKIILGETI